VAAAAHSASAPRRGTAALVRRLARLQAALSSRPHGVNRYGGSFGGSQGQPGSQGDGGAGGAAAALLQLCWAQADAALRRLDASDRSAATFSQV